MKFVSQFSFGNHQIGEGHPPFIIAEISANHGQNLDKALNIVHAAATAGADAIKMQTYTADTLTLKSDKEDFRVGAGTLWEGRTLHDLYSEAYTPWEWHQPIKELAESLGMEFFSTPFDATAVDYLENLGVAAYKIASFEIVDIGLIERVAKTGKPLIISTGMTSREEIQEALNAVARANNNQVALLKCTSGYPAKEDEMNLRTIPALRDIFQVPVGLSDHTLTTAIPAAAVALGACVIEKHLTLSRAEGGPDGAFSLEPHEFTEMVSAVRKTYSALGTVSHDCGESESKSRAFRRSLYAVENIRAGDPLTERNVRSIRPGHGLHTRYLPQLLKSFAAQDIERGTALDWQYIRGGKPPSV
ncbi:MAG: pseudaminic acid synthase [Chthoniobacterales bacterium]